VAAAQPLALASPALVEHVRALTAAAVAAWQARWGLARLNADIAVAAWEEASRPRVDAAGEWHDAEAGTPASVFWPSSTPQRIEGKLFPCVKHEVRSAENSLARDSARQVGEDLWRALLACWQVQAARAAGAGSTGPRWSRWRAPVQVRIDLGKGCRIVAVLSGAALHPRTPAPRGRLGALDMRSFHALPAHAELLLGRAEIALPDIAALQVGDVIVLDTRIHDPLTLRLQGGAAALHACLGRAGDRRAAQLVSHSKTKGST
jgi:flagellar motor switch/type III secretory pathway protein FliN